MRINKFLAECGVASRRNAESLVLDGRVKMNGKQVTGLAVDVNPDKDEVTLDGKRVKPVEAHAYLMLHKPKGVVTTTADDKGRKTVLDLVKTEKRLFPVGRLDYDTEGLLLLTTDGDLCNALTHPSNEVPKTYVANIKGELVESELAVLRAGVVIDGERTARARIKRLGFKDNLTRLEITITEGKNRQIRRMFEAIGKDVDFLKRIKIGDIRLGGLYRGESRPLTEKEVAYLKGIEKICKRG